MFGNHRKTLLFVVTSVVASLCVLWMQGRFEASDVRHAQAIVQQYRPKGGASIPDALSHLHPGKGVQWDSRTQSSCFQHIRVYASVNADPSKAPLVYIFIVDLNGPGIHPGNEAGQSLLSMLGKPLPKPAKTVTHASPTSSASATPAASAQPSASAQPMKASPTSSNLQP